MSGSITQQNPVGASAVVANGDELHVVTMNPLGKSDDTYQWDIFYMHRSLDAAHIPPQTLEAPTPTLQATATSTALASTTPVPLSFQSPNRTAAYDPMVSIMAGVIPAFLLILVGLIIGIWSKKIKGGRR
jgi:hypothetical protein